MSLSLGAFTMGARYSNKRVPFLKSWPHRFTILIEQIFNLKLLYGFIFQSSLILHWLFVFPKFWLSDPILKEVGSQTFLELRIFFEMAMVARLCGNKLLEIKESIQIKYSNGGFIYLLAVLRILAVARIDTRRALLKARSVNLK